MKLTKQNLTDVVKAFNDTFAHDQVLQKIKNQKHIMTQGAITALMLCEPERLEAKGVYANYEFGVCEEATPLIAVYIGLYGAGIVAAYYAKNDEWHECQSHGNCGKNYASGGTWTTTAKHKGAKYVPQIVKLIIKGI